MLQGILPDTPVIDPEVALRTAEKVWEVWTNPKIFGWGRPVLAINAVRVGRPERAINHLTEFDRWIFDDAGMFLSYHNRSTTLLTRIYVQGFAVRGGKSESSGTTLPFIPGNAAFLYAGKCCNEI